SPGSPRKSRTRRRLHMAILVIGATGFIGPRLIRKLIARGESVVGMDLNPGAAAFSDVPIGAPVVRGDITQFEDVMRTVIGVRPANVTGPDKVRGSVDHVQIMTEAARGKPVQLPAKGLMRLLVHVEDMAEIFARILLAEAPRHHLYNSGGIPVSLGELADVVRGFMPDAQITFAKEDGRESTGNYLVDNSSLTKE